MEPDFLDFLVQRGHLAPQRRDAIRQATRSAREPIGAIAFSHGLLNGEDVDLILSEQRGQHRPFGQIASELGMLTQAQVQSLVRIQHARTALSLAEALCLAGVVPLDVSLAELSAFLSAPPQRAAA
jgi:hypothetical protein